MAHLWRLELSPPILFDLVELFDFGTLDFSAILYFRVVVGHIIGMSKSCRREWGSFGVLFFGFLVSRFFGAFFCFFG